MSYSDSPSQHACPQCSPWLPQAVLEQRDDLLHEQADGVQPETERRDREVAPLVHRSHSPCTIPCRCMLLPPVWCCRQYSAELRYTTRLQSPCRSQREERVCSTRLAACSACSYGP